MQGVGLLFYDSESDVLLLSLPSPIPETYESYLLGSAPLPVLVLFRQRGCPPPSPSTPPSPPSSSSGEHCSPVFDENFTHYHGIFSAGF